MTDTQHYQLNQWAADDQVLRMDFNADNAKIDAALGEHAQKLNWLGNCRIETGTYVGTGEKGEEHPISLMFSGKPLAILAGGGGADTLVAIRGVYDYIYILGITTSNKMYITWGDNSVTWYATSGPDHQCNLANKTYTYLAFLTEE